MSEIIAVTLFYLYIAIPALILYPLTVQKFERKVAWVLSLFCSFFLFGSLRWAIHRYIGVDVWGAPVWLAIIIALYFRKRFYYSYIDILKQLSFSFFVFLFLYLLICSYTPMINGEKLMDMSMLQFFSRRLTLPAQDPWLGGNYLHYYYLGYYLVGRLFKDLMISFQYTYLLSITFYFFLFITALALFVRGKNLMQHYLFAFLGLGLTITPVLSLFTAKEVPLQFWMMTRIYHNNSFFVEFPLWSYLFQDLHPHLMSAPLVLLAIYFIFKHHYQRKEMILLSICLSVILFVNSWDFIFLNSLVFCYALYYKKPKLFVAQGLSLFFSILWIAPLATGRSITFGLQQAPLLLLKGTLISFSVLIILLIILLWRTAQKRKIYFPLAFAALLIGLSSLFFLFDPTNTIFKIMTSLGVFLLAVTLFYIDSWKFYLLGGVGIILFFSSHYTYFHWPNNRFHPIFSKRLVAKVLEKDSGIKKFCKKHPACLFIEDPGKSYDFSKLQLSALTGIPTFIGKKQHLEVRNGVAIDVVINRRISLVNELFTGVLGDIRPRTILCESADDIVSLQTFNREKCLVPAQF